MKLRRVLTNSILFLFLVLTHAQAQDPDLIWEKEEGLSVVEFSPDGKWLMTHGTRAQDIVFRNLADGEIMRTFSHPENVQEAKFSPDGKLIASGIDGGKVFIWNIEENRIIHTFGDTAKNNNKSADCLDFSEDGRYLAQGSYGLPGGLEFENNVYVWDIQEGKLVWKDRKFLGYAKVQFVWGTPYLYVTTSLEYRAGLYDALTGTFVKDASARRFYSPDGKLYAVSIKNQSDYFDIAIHQTENDKRIAFFPTNYSELFGNEFTPNGKFFMFSIYKANIGSSTQLWDIETSKFIRYHTTLGEIAISFDSQFIATSYHSKTQLYKANWTPTSILNDAKNSFLLKISPNPATDQTTISFALPSPQKVTCSIISITGETVATLLKDQIADGEQTLTWQTAGIAQGMHFVQLNVAGRLQTQPVFITH
ncbi:MAG: T9SS type A sorting domain-containing protein [Bacteroidota bacterium]